LNQATNINLTKALFSATFLAIVLLVTVILPAEYNIDPTGVGEKIGLTVFQDNTSDTAQIAPLAQQQENRHEVEVVVPAGRGVEYKFQMAKFAKMEYEWLTDGDALYFDLHGEPEGDETGYFESYAITTGATMKGSFTTPFAGSHGWYWKNTSDKPVTVYLVANGTFEVTGLKH